MSRISQAGSKVRYISYRPFVIVDMHLQQADLVLEVVNFEAHLTPVVVCLRPLLDLTLEDGFLAARPDGELGLGHLHNLLDGHVLDEIRDVDLLPVLVHA